MTEIVNETNPADRVVRASDGRKHTRLREFQAQLVERMQAAQRSGFVQLSQLGVMIGGSRYLLDLREAGEIVSVGTLSSVPLTRDWYKGLSNIRGNLTSVVDLSRFLGSELTEVNPSCRIVAFAPALMFNAGLLVSQVFGLRNLNDMTLLDGDVATREWLPRRFSDQDGHIWSELSLSTLVRDQDFLHIAL